MNSFKISGRTVHFDEILEGLLDFSSLTAFEQDTMSFIKEWLMGKKKFSLKTSGTTGKPKTVFFSRDQMKKSAQRTLTTFGLHSGDKILICLNTNYVAGKMMLVRGIEGELQMEIIEPSSHPLQTYDLQGIIDFAAFVPKQLEAILENTPSRLNNVRKVLIGGAELHPDLEDRCQRLSSEVFHSYASTETLTHQAIRAVNGSERSGIFTAIEDVSFSIDQRSCLVINDGILEIKDLVTNDVVELLSDTSFRWRGRHDNVINSGGIKIQIEENEQLVNQLLAKNGINYPFYLAAKRDKILSQKLVLILQAKSPELQINAVLRLLKDGLPKYHAPKEIILVPKLFFTKTGKLDRLRNSKAYVDFNNQV